MITIEQIRAARAMLNWSQRQLAEAAGISRRSLISIEAGLVVPRLPTLKAIKNAMEKARIIFADDCTVSLRRDVFEISRHEGIGAIEALSDELIECFRSGEREVLLCNTDERRWLENKPQAVHERYHKALTSMGVEERCLIAYGDTVIISAPEFYRWMPREYYSEASYIVCGNLLAIVVWQPILRIVKIYNKDIAVAYRKHFECLWEQSTIPPFAVEVMNNQLAVGAA